jgi:hypothetical protein
MLAAPRMSLQAQSRARLDLQNLDLKARSFFKDLVAAPGSFVKLSHCFPPHDSKVVISNSSAEDMLRHGGRANEIQIHWWTKI